MTSYHVPKTCPPLSLFSPSVFFYLATVCPSVWFLELDRAYKAAAGIIDVRNETAGSSDVVTVVIQAATHDSSLPIKIDVNQLSDSDWLKIFEQALMVILIVGRWLLPKGELTRDQLSQLLLVYIGMAADIIEIFEAFREPKVVQTIELVYTTLALWTWSLMQFTLILTATKARKPRAGTHTSFVFDQFDLLDDEDAGGPCSCCWWCSADIWGILTTLILQDGPFLCLRLTFLFRYNVVSYSNVFFTIKNSLVCEASEPEVELRMRRLGHLKKFSTFLLKALLTGNCSPSLPDGGPSPLQQKNERTGGPAASEWARRGWDASAFQESSGKACFAP
ncbi:hypothetical protein RvY_17613-2 [Ramazzottius varieornatus]|uniref:Transmembrane protein 26 n=1 Tax=Ramazzottius varieornatus TaxID=947166 RepID=A0A1D1W4W3_RAMVA|nr:hypothetical protein RvY_17613-2 [Ramazzottius varieornatus]